MCVCFLGDLEKKEKESETNDETLFLSRNLLFKK